MKKEKIMKRVIFVVVLLIPVIYSFFYLKSYWNPYGDLTGIKIAVVNLDEGKDGENQGVEFVNGLKESNTFKICDVSLDEANKGMQDGDYYAMILIPSNFTSYLNSASTTDKQIATITYSPNQASNYLASQIINSGVKTMELNLKSKINSQITRTLASKLKSVPDSLEEILDGSNQILDGSKSLNSGLEQINTGVNTLNNSYTDFDNGINSAYNGSVSLDSGISQVSEGISSLSSGATSLDSAIAQISAGADSLSTQGSEGIVTLAQGVSSLNEGASTLSSGVNTYVDGTVQFASGTSNYIDGTSSLVSNMNNYIDSVDALDSNVYNLLVALSSMGATSSDTNMQVLANQAQQIIDSGAINKLTYSGAAIKQGGATLTQSNETLKGAATQLTTSGENLKQGASTLYSGTQSLVQGTSSLSDLSNGILSLKNALAQVKSGTTTLNSGISTLDSGVNALQSGADSLTQGLYTINSSSSQIKSALNTLSDGVASAYDGSLELIDGIETFNSEVSDGLEDANTQLETLNGIEDFSENPVNFETEAYGDVSSYGVAFTPLFLCIGLWVGALMCYVVLYYDQKNRFGIFDSNYNNKILQNIIYVLIGAAEGIITGLLLKLGLGYDVENTLLYYLSSMLIGITFMSIIQFLIRNFGDIGKFLALIILVLQLAASGGTFPVETIDKVFQAISPYLPMTYSIKLLREILVPTATNFKTEYILIHLAIIVVTFAITNIVDVVKKSKVKED